MGRLLATDGGGLSGMGLVGLMPGMCGVLDINL